MSRKVEYRGNTYLLGVDRLVCERDGEDIDRCLMNDGESPPTELTFDDVDGVAIERLVNTTSPLMEVQYGENMGGWDFAVGFDSDQIGCVYYGDAESIECGNVTFLEEEINRSTASRR